MDSTFVDNEPEQAGNSIDELPVQYAPAGSDRAQLDVCSTDCPLFARIITPRVASDSGAQGDRYDILATENLRCTVAGKPLLNVIDIERGY